MVRERINELVDFATTESPYSSSTKGWLSNDVYLKWGPQKRNNSFKSEELFKLSVLWGPLNKIVSNLFIVFIVASLLFSLVLSIDNNGIDLSFLSTEKIETTSLIQEPYDSLGPQVLEREIIKEEIPFNPNTASEESNEINKLAENSQPDIQTSIDSYQNVKKVTSGYNFLSP